MKATTASRHQPLATGGFSKNKPTSDLVRFPDNLPDKRAGVKRL